MSFALRLSLALPKGCGDSARPEPADAPAVLRHSAARFVGAALYAAQLCMSNPLVAYRRTLKGLNYDPSHNLSLLTTAWLQESNS